MMVMQLLMQVGPSALPTHCTPQAPAMVAMFLVQMRSRSVLAAHMPVLVVATPSWAREMLEKLPVHIDPVASLPPASEASASLVAPSFGGVVLLLLQATRANES